jgi:hypothetical protein
MYALDAVLASKHFWSGRRRGWRLRAANLMRIKNLIIFLLILLPLIFGVLASFVAQVLWNPVPILLFKIDVGILASWQA